MILIPSNFPDKNKDTSLISYDLIDKRLKKITLSLDSLFNNYLLSRNNFGANEVWAFYTKKWKMSEKIFFPDVAIFSTKVRLVDLFHKFFYACYSDFSYKNAKNKLRGCFVPKLLKLDHPYLLIDKNWNNVELRKKLFFFKKNAILFLPKSAGAVKRTISKKTLIAGIKKCMIYSDTGVTLCVYYRDLDFYRKINLPRYVSFVSCGSRFDILFYYRLNLLIKSHKFIAYFEPGSHSIFGAVSNKMQLYLNMKIKQEFLDAYQASRYPKNKDLIIFHRIFSEQFKGERKLKPIYINDLKQFLSFGRLVPKVKDSINTMYYLNFFWFKLIKRLVKIEDYFFKRKLN
jgi:hypothetical protein